MKHVLFVGRWQPVHKGHIALWRAGAWDHGLPALIYVRDIPPNEKNPFTTEQTVELIELALVDLGKTKEEAKVIVGPDIDAVRYGRGVGYKVEEIDLPPDIKGISATEIRRRVRDAEFGWHDLVTTSVAKQLTELLK